MNPAAPTPEYPGVSAQQTPDDPAALALAGETSILSRWDALAAQIAEASAADEALPPWDYANDHDQKDARSWIARLRRLRARIEGARKDAKAVHLERGRAVDATARCLQEAVDGLIARHLEPIRALEEAEAARVASHRAVLQRIELLARGYHIPSALAGLSLETFMGEGFIPTLDRVETAEQAAEALSQLQAIESLLLIDPTALEEFRGEAEAAIAQALPELRDRLARLQQQEAERAELERLRLEAAEREAQDREKAIRQEAAEAARLAAQERERAAAQAQAAAEARAAEAEERARQLEKEALRRVVQEEAQQIEAVRHRLSHDWCHGQAQERTDQFVTDLTAAIAPYRSARKLAWAIVAGELHPALTVNWDLVLEPPSREPQA